MFYDTASALFGVAGLRVTDVEDGPGGVVEVWAVTGHEGAAVCPDCGTESSRVHDVVVTCPADVRRAGDPVALNWVKRRLKCGNAGCPRKTFTERCPAVPPGCRVMPRLRAVPEPDLLQLYGDDSQTEKSVSSLFVLVCGRAGAAAAQRVHVGV